MNVLQDKIERYFKKLRFNKNHHLGSGDIRLTIAQQDEIVEIAKGENVEIRNFISRIVEDVRNNDLSDRNLIEKYVREFKIISK